MMTFNELKIDVYGIALQKFGQLTLEVKQRLDRSHWDECST